MSLDGYSGILPETLVYPTGRVQAVRQSCGLEAKKLTDQSKVLLNIELPQNFPDKYEKTIRKAVDNCLVARLGKGLNENSFESSISRANEK